MSIDESRECPNCKIGRCTKSTDTKTLEEYTICIDCGYLHKKYIQRDDKGNIILIDVSEGLVEDNMTRGEMLIDKPYGMAFYEIKHSGFNPMFPIENEEEYLNFVEFINSNADKIVQATISRFVDDEIKLEVIVDNREAYKDESLNRLRELEKNKEKLGKQPLFVDTNEEFDLPF